MDLHLVQYTAPYRVQADLAEQKKNMNRAIILRAKTTSTCYLDRGEVFWGDPEVHRWTHGLHDPKASSLNEGYGN